MEWRPDRSALPLIAAVGSFAFWGIGTLAGTHPDGAILGFSGTMWMIWATAEKEVRRREDREEREDEDDGGNGGEDDEGTDARDRDRKGKQWDSKETRTKKRRALGKLTITKDEREYDDG